MNEKYMNFFEELKKFKEKQQKQKERGLNDYNLLTTVLNEYDEVRLHSRVIGSLLDVNGLHYQRELFLEKFLEILKVDEFEFDIHESKLFFEYQNIDLYLTDGTKHIIIENKIYAGDQENQIKRYYEIIKNENKSLKYDDILIIYLSIDRPKPSAYSLGTNLTIKDNNILDNDEKIAIFKNINYTNEILNWLDNCLHEIQNITNLNESIQQYKNVVEKITNKYKEKGMSIKEFLLENNNLKLAMGLKDSIKEAKIEIQLLFWEELKEELNKHDGYNFEFVNFEFKEIDIKSSVTNYYNMSKNNKDYGLKHDVMKISNIHTLSFFIQINWNIYFGFTIAENGKTKDIAQDEQFADLSKNILDMNKFEGNSKNTQIDRKLWICCKYPETRLDFYSFTSDNIFNLVDENNRKKIISDIVKEIVDVITTFNQSQGK